MSWQKFSDCRLPCLVSEGVPELFSQMGCSAAGVWWMVLQNASAVQEVCSGEAVGESVSYLDVYFKKIFHLCICACVYAFVHACMCVLMHVCVYRCRPEEGTGSPAEEVTDSVRHPACYMQARL